MVLENSTRQRKMQNDINHVYKWARDNNMCFNGDKFEHMRYGPPESNMVPYLTPNGNAIPQVEAVKDLGVVMESSANFTQQISEATKRSSNLASWILRVFHTRCEITMMTLFRSMVVPHLEYCCQLWSPSLLGDIRKLEAVQRSFTSRISGFGHLSYWERLKKLQFYSLERRRERYMILYIYKIIKGLVPNYTSHRFKIEPYLSVRGNRMCRIPAINTHATSRTKNLVEKSFPVQGPRLFNCLPAQVRNFDGSFESFKSQVDKFLTIIPDQPCTTGYHQSVTSNSIVAQLAQMRADGIFI